MEPSRESLRVLIAMNGFKGSLTNEEACQAVALGLKELGVQSVSLPIGDGGKGSRRSLQNKWRGEEVTISARGPLGQSTQAKVLCLPDRKNPNALYLESPDVCGYLESKQRNAMDASSSGLGKLLLDSQTLGKPQTIYIGLGDSAVSDAGLGMLSELGFVFGDRDGAVLPPNGEGLTRLHEIIAPQASAFASARFVVLCDVQNSLCGDKGSARTFAPQKGATPEQVLLLEKGMERFAVQAELLTGKSLGLSPMTGSAGGLSAALKAFFKAELVSGSHFILEEVGFDDELKACDLLITGEGKTDAQTFSGKAPGECLQRAAGLEKYSLVISGSVGEGAEHSLDLKDPKFLGCFACGNEPNAFAALKEKTKKVWEAKRGLLIF